MAQKYHRPDLSAPGRVYSEESGDFAATWFVFAGLVLAAVLIYFVLSWGEASVVTGVQNPDLPALLTPASGD